MINFFSAQDAIYFDIETNHLIMFDLHFHNISTISYLFGWDKLLIMEIYLQMDQTNGEKYRDGEKMKCNF